MEQKCFQLDDGFSLWECQGEGLAPFINDGNVLPCKLSRNVVLICQRGVIMIEMNLQKYMLRANDMLYINKDVILQQMECSSDSAYMLCVFKVDYYAEMNVDNSLFHLRLFVNPVIHLEQAEMDEVIMLYRLMERKIAEQDNSYRQKAINGYNQVLMSVGYNSMRKAQALLQQRYVSRSQEVFMSFLQLVQQHFRQEHSITFYADKICLTPKYLSQLVQQASGLLAGEWINRYLLLEAQALLLSRRYTVVEISESLNFSSPSAFIAFFKKHTGKTPKRYMNKSY